MARRPVLLIYERVVLSPLEQEINTFITNLKDKIYKPDPVDNKKKLDLIFNNVDFDEDLKYNLGQKIYNVRDKETDTDIKKKIRKVFDCYKKKGGYALSDFRRNAQAKQRQFTLNLKNQKKLDDAEKKNTMRLFKLAQKQFENEQRTALRQQVRKEIVEKNKIKREEKAKILKNFKSCIVSSQIENVNALLNLISTENNTKEIFDLNISSINMPTEKEIGLQLNQLSVMALAKLRADNKIDTPGLLVNHSTGSGKTLIGLMILLEFWDKYWYDKNANKNRMWAILLTSTRKNQREDNNIDKLADLCIKYFSSFTTTVYNGHEFGWNNPDDNTPQEKNAIFSIDFYTVYMELIKNGTDVDKKEYNSYEGPGGSGHMGWVKFQLRKRLWQGIEDSFIGNNDRDLPPNSQKMIKNYKSRRKTISGVDKTLYLYASLGYDLFPIFYKNDREPPKTINPADTNKGFRDIIITFVKTIIKTTLKKQDFDNIKHEKFLSAVNIFLKTNITEINDYIAENPNKEIIEDIQKNCKIDYPEHVYVKYCVGTGIFIKNITNEQIKEMYNEFKQTLTDLGFQITLKEEKSRRNKTENYIISYKNPDDNVDTVEDEIENDDEDQEENDDVDKKTGLRNESLYLQLNANRQLQNCVFVLDEVQTFFNPPKDENEKKYDYCLKGLTHYRDPKTTWLVALTATPGSSPEEVATLFNLINCVPYTNKETKKPLQTAEFPNEKIQLLNKLQEEKYRLLISKVDYSGDTNRYPVIQMNRKNVHILNEIDNKSIYYSAFCEKKKIFEASITEFEKNYRPLKSNWKKDKEKKNGKAYVEFHGYYGVKIDINNNSLCPALKIEKTVLPLLNSEILETYRNLNLFIFQNHDNTIKPKKDDVSLSHSNTPLNFDNESDSETDSESIFLGSSDSDSDSDPNPISKPTPKPKINPDNKFLNNFILNNVPFNKCNYDFIASPKFMLVLKSVLNGVNVCFDPKEKIEFITKLIDANPNPNPNPNPVVGKHYIYCSSKRCLQGFAYYLHWYSKGMLQPINEGMTLNEILEKKEKGVRFFYFANDVTNVPFKLVCSQGKSKIAKYLATSDTTFENYLKLFPDDDDKDWVKTVTEKIGSLRLDLDELMNIKGDIVPIILACGEAFKGVDLKGVTDIHAMESFTSMQDLIQLIGRGPRMYSHKDLPDKNKHVNVHLYFSNTEELHSTFENNGKCKSDVWLYNENKEGYNDFLKEFYDLMQEKACDKKTFEKVHNKIGMNDFINRLLNIDPNIEYGGITEKDEMKEYINNTKRNVITNKTFTIDDNNFDILKKKYINEQFENDYKENKTKNTAKQHLKKLFEIYLQTSILFKPTLP